MKRYALQTTVLMLSALALFAIACEGSERPSEPGFVPETITFPDGYKAQEIKTSNPDALGPADVAADTGSPDSAVDSQETTPPDTAEPPPEPQPEVVEEASPEIILDNSKATGVGCEESGECVSDLCLSGEFTSAHCALLCSSDADCKGPDQLWNGTCSAVGGADFTFCIFFCGAMGGECPGELSCDGAACR